MVTVNDARHTRECFETVVPFEVGKSGFDRWHGLSFGAAIEGEEDAALLDSIIHAGPPYFRDLIPEYSPADVGFRTRHGSRRVRN